MVQEFDLFVEEAFSQEATHVDQMGAIDLRQAFETGVVEGSFEESAENYNDIDDPKSIIGTPDDVFAADRAAKAYKKAVDSKSAKSDMSPEGGESA